MRQALRSKLIILGILTLIVFIGVISTFAEPDFTTECGDCHEQHPISAALTRSSNATGTVNVTVGSSFTLRIEAEKGVGGTNFWLSVQAGWADNDNFTFTPDSIRDGSVGDLTIANFIVTHDFTFTAIVSGNQTIRAWCATYSASQFIDIPINVTDVPDVTAPTIDSPVDIPYVIPTTGHNINWTPYDENPSHFRVLVNGSVILSGGWNGQSIIVNVDFLSPGTYEYTLIVFDASNNNASDIVIVSVTGNLPT
ncbi:hypothetical protein EU528_14185, partial [Candidatus Thorarchaeota archaeon]